jgi:hypothetical protein
MEYRKPMTDEQFERFWESCQTNDLVKYSLRSAIDGNVSHLNTIMMLNQAVKELEIKIAILENRPMARPLTREQVSRVDEYRGTPL